MDRAVLNSPVWLINKLSPVDRSSACISHRAVFLIERQSCLSNTGHLLVPNRWIVCIDKLVTKLPMNRSTDVGMSSRRWITVQSLLTAMQRRIEIEYIPRMDL